MKRRLVPVLCAALALIPGVVPAQEENDLEAKLRETVPKESDAASIQIIDKHLQVLGGVGRLRTITNTVSHGIKREGKEEWDITITRAAPNKLRIETTKTEMGRPDTTIEGTNGEAYWTFRPEVKNALPAEMSKKQAEQFSLEADFYGPLVNREEKGYIFQYEGEAKSRGRKHYLVKMFYPNGHTAYFYFDTKTLMVTRVGREEIISNTIVDTDTYYTKFERVDGVWMPSQLEFALEDQVFGSLKLSDIEPNRPLDSTTFDIPRVKEVWLRKK